MTVAHPLKAVVMASAAVNTRPLTRLLLCVRTVEVIDGNAVIAGFLNHVKNVCPEAAEELFPAVSAAVTGIDIAGILIDEEDPKMVDVRLSGCGESRVVLGKIHDVVDLDRFSIDRAHSAPPVSPPSIVADIVKRAPIRWVSPMEVRDLTEPSMTTLAARIPTPATDERKAISGWVKVVKLAELVKSVIAVGSITAP